LLGGQQHHATPACFTDQCGARLPTRDPDTVLDPQCGEGALVNLGSWRTTKYGIDIDNRLTVPSPTLITYNCVKVGDPIDELYPNLHRRCINANPPFGKKWTLPVAQFSRGPSVGEK
jgi:hypothetical protein